MSRFHRKVKMISAAGLLTVPVLLAGCSALSSQTSDSVDAPPPILESAMIQAAEGNGEMVQTEQMTVYLKDQNGLLAPVSMSLPALPDLTFVESSLAALVSGGAYSGYMPDGFTGVLPQGTEVMDVTVTPEEKLAVVEFNSKFTEYMPEEERQIMEAVTWTLTGNPDIQNVQLWVDGKKLNEMPVNGTPMAQSLTRGIGINLDLGNHLSTNSSPVTVYFSDESPAGEQYYVPVTRLVEPSPNRVESALSELIKGPDSEGLEMVLTTATLLESVVTGEDGTVSVALKDEMFAEGDPIPTELLQSVVLTVADNSGNADTKVQITFNDQQTVIGIDEQNYGEPVTKPEYINEIGI
ncbi:GerMN domain-containing protein [Paenibacillus shunpengii]|uniref:GerMN domain-containing protein n=1 Tax=Paenibacillus shunpengii TaxID=2054424 RepID=A0ABW5SUS9_9BACL